MALRSLAHDVLASMLFQPLALARRCTRPSYRTAVLAYTQGLRFRRAASAWGDEQRREWILQQLRRTVRRAWADTVHYRTLFAVHGFDPRADFDFDDFARLPVLERGAVATAGASLLSSAVDHAVLRRDSSGGSTGAPVEVWLGPEERGWQESAMEHFMAAVGAPRGCRLAYLWGHHLDPVASDAWRDRVRDFVDNVRWFDCFRLSSDTLQRYHAELQAYRPACVVAYASALAALAQEAGATGTTPQYPRRCFVTGAEKLMPRERAIVQEVYGRPVHERYGTREIGLIAFQLGDPRTLDLQVDWANVLVEPDTASPYAGVLVTKLHADGMPFIRYRLGDIARFPLGSRPGHPVLALHEVLGRETDRVWLRDGRWIHGIQFPHLLRDHPVQEFQVVQHADHSVVLRIVPGPRFQPVTVRAVLDTLTANLPGIPVRLELVTELGRTAASKRRVVMSEVGPR